MGADLESLEAAIGYSFRNRDLLVRALTHSSSARENQVEADAQPADNERMEFLGDSLLGFLVSELLFARFAGYSEGRLTERKAHLVSAVHLVSVARKLDLGQYLLLGRSEEMTGGRSKPTLLENCLEAVIAAMYLDGGIEVARAFIGDSIFDSDADQSWELHGFGAQNRNAKGQLEELVRARGLGKPRYMMLKTRGPDHSKTFTVEVRVGADWIAQGEGPSKKSAEQKAAGEVLRILEESTAP